MTVVSRASADVPEWQSVASSSEAALLDYAGSVDGAHVAVIGDGTLEVMCSLIRRGCTAAVELSLQEHEHATVEPAEIAVVPRLGSIEQARRAVALASRLLQPGGQIVLRDTSGLLALHVTALLRMRGFSRVRVRVLGDGTMIRAERPILRRFARA
jgi:hypothetical protein